MSFDEVRHYYAQFSEWERLESPAGRLEFVRTMRILDRHLPAQGRIFDLGGGPGRYTIALAEKGYRVCLADLSPHQLEAARERIAEAGVGGQVESVDEANATDLGRYADASFDAVLALGPFYHLVVKEDRARAATEIARVLKEGGVAFAAFVPRLMGVTNLIERAASDPEQVTRENFREALEDGVFHNAAPRGFQEGYYAGPSDARDLVASAGLTCMEYISLRGIAFGREEALWTIEERDPALFADMFAALERTADEPEVIASGGHALCVCRKG